jgi:hypothetical protein
MGEAKSAQQSESKPPIKQGRKPLFLLSIKPGETWEQFKERVVTTAHETGFLKRRSRTNSRGGDRCAGWGLFVAFILIES